MPAPSLVEVPKITGRGGRKPGSSKYIDDLANAAKAWKLLVKNEGKGWIGNLADPIDKDSKCRNAATAWKTAIVQAALDEDYLATFGESEFPDALAALKERIMTRVFTSAPDQWVFAFALRPLETETTE